MAKLADEQSMAGLEGREVGTGSATSEQPLRYVPDRISRTGAARRVVSMVQHSGDVRARPDGIMVA